MRGDGLSQIGTSCMQFLFVTNFKFFHFNCRCLEENIRNDDDDRNEDNKKQAVHYTNGPCLITDLTQFIQQTRETKINRLNTNKATI